jgi:tripartite-type tricarboxylate transporter receptor subunit TctC
MLKAVLPQLGLIQPTKAIRSMRYIFAPLGLLVTALPAVAVAQPAFPDRAIRIIVPFPPGGAVDLIARLVSARITEANGWAFVVESRAGAGGVIASDAVAKAAPDGHTLLITTPNHTINAALRAKLPYDTERDLVPVAMVAEIPMLLVSHPDAPFADFKGLIAYAKANPKKLNYSSAGNGTLPQVAKELLFKLAGIEVVHVAYRGAAPAMTDLVAGVVQLKYDTFATSRELMAAGKLKALVYSGAKRSALMPDVPAVAELGFPGYEAVLWNAFMAPAGVPLPILDRLHAAATQALRTPGLVARYAQEGIEPGAGTPAEIAARIKREIAQWTDLARSVKITLD